MSRRIVGQCSTVDFRYLEHLSDLMARGGEVDTSNLTSRQKIAVRVLQHFQKHNVPFKVLLKIREVLIWEDENKGLWFEYKLVNVNDGETRGILRRMHKGGE